MNWNIIPQDIQFKIINTIPDIQTIINLRSTSSYNKCFIDNDKILSKKIYSKKLLYDLTNFINNHLIYDWLLYIYECLYKEIDTSETLLIIIKFILNNDINFDENKDIVSDIIIVLIDSDADVTQSIKYILDNNKINEYNDNYISKCLIDFLQSC